MDAPQHVPLILAGTALFLFLQLAIFVETHILKCQMKNVKTVILNPLMAAAQSVKSSEVFTVKESHQSASQSVGTQSRLLMRTVKLGIKKDVWKIVQRLLRALNAKAKILQYAFLRQIKIRLPKQLNLLQFPQLCPHL